MSGGMDKIFNERGNKAKGTLGEPMGGIYEGVSKRL